MRQHLNTTRDSLHLENLPKEIRTELNYRTRLTTPKQEHYMMLRRLGWAVVMPAALFVLRGFTNSYGQLLAIAGFAVALWCVVSMLWRFLTGMPLEKLPFAAAVAFAVSAIAWLWTTTPTPLQAFIVLVLPTLWLTLDWAEAVARQVCYWMAVNMRVEHQTMKEWKSVLQTSRLGEIPNRCPEAILPMLFKNVFWMIALLILGAMWWSEKSGVADRVSAYAVPVLLLIPIMLWFAWNSSGVTTRFPIGLTVRVAWTALTVWLTYNRHQARAAGLFQFPTPWTRSPFVRDATTGLICLAWGIASLPLLTGMELTPTEDRFRILWAWLGPVLMTLGIFWCVFGSLLTRFWLALESPEAYDVSKTASEWDNAVERILNSFDELERNHLLLGTSFYGDYPVYLHRPLLDQHAHILGGTGASKTSLGISPLMTQLIASEDCSVVVVDLKGDPSLFQSARIEAAREKVKFKWFTNIPECPSYVFNPLEQAHVPLMNPNQKTQTVIEAMGLSYGSGYGRAFFSSQNEVVLLKYMENYPGLSFRELHMLLRDKSSFAKLGEESEWKNARHLSALVDRLASIEPFNVNEHDLKDRPEAWANRMDVGDLFNERQVNYFYLASPREPQTAASIAKFVLYSLFSAAALRIGQKKHRVYVFIDEFQMLVSDNIKLILTQARSLGLSVILVHQSSGQLKADGVNLISTVESCVAFTQNFRVTEPEEIRRIEQSSGLGRFHTLTWQQRADARMNDPNIEEIFNLNRAVKDTVEVSETIGPMLNQNVIQEISATPGASFVKFCEGSGYTQFGGYYTPIKSQFHISAEEYDRRSTAPWPEPSPETIVVRDRYVRSTDGTPSNRAPVSANHPSPPDWDSRLAEAANSATEP